jgi:CRISPR/Cas system CMR-associated protein Cmr5 small subunit
MNKKIKEGLEMDMTTYKKVKGTIDPKTPIKITGDKPETNSALSEDNSDTVIEPKDKSTIKYLSNVKDSKTGKISKPFTIGDKKYQMVRGTTPSNEIVMGVYCHDETDENGYNIIHPIEYFEENIANPMKEQMGMVGQNIQSSPKQESIEITGNEKAFQDKDAFIDYLNLVGLEGYKHFFVNINTGEIVGKFKSTKDMVTSGIKLGPNEDYMDIKSLKRFRFGDYFKSNVSEAPVDDVEGTNVGKLQSDVKKLANMIKTKFSIYLSKLDKPIEQAQFLTAMADEIGVPLNKLSTIITSFKDIAKTEVSTQSLSEKKIISKRELEESIMPNRVIKTIKVKDIK